VIADPTEVGDAGYMHGSALAADPDRLFLIGAKFTSAREGDRACACGRCGPASIAAAQAPGYISALSAVGDPRKSNLSQHNLSISFRGSRCCGRPRVRSVLPAYREKTIRNGFDLIESRRISTEYQGVVDGFEGDSLVLASRINLFFQAEASRWEDSTLSPGPWLWREFGRRTALAMELNEIKLISTS